MVIILAQGAERVEQGAIHDNIGDHFKHDA
jgi:hypothetical protein